MKTKLWIALFAAWCALGPKPARAAGVYDPELDYYTLTTPNFLVMYTAGYEHIALRAGEIAENTLPYLVDRYGWKPAGRISIIRKQHDPVDSAGLRAGMPPVQPRQS